MSQPSLHTAQQSFIYTSILRTPAEGISLRLNLNLKSCKCQYKVEKYQRQINKLLNWSLAGHVVVAAVRGCNGLPADTPEHEDDRDHAEQREADHLGHEVVRVLRTRGGPERGPAPAEEGELDPVQGQHGSLQLAISWKK